MEPAKYHNPRRNSTFSAKIITHNYRGGIRGKTSTTIESSTRIFSGAADNLSHQTRKRAIKNLSSVLQAELSYVQNIATTILNEQHYMTQQALEIFCCLIIQKSVRAYLARCFLSKLKYMRFISQRMWFRLRYYRKVKVRQKARAMIARHLFYYCYNQRKKRKAMYKKISTGFVTCIIFTGLCRALTRIEYIQHQKKIFDENSCCASLQKRSKSSPAIRSMEILLSPSPSTPYKTIRPSTSRLSAREPNEFGVVPKDITLRDSRSISNFSGSKSIDSPTHLLNLLSKFDTSQPVDISLFQDQDYTERLRSRTFSDIDNLRFPFTAISLTFQEPSLSEDELFRNRLDSDVDAAVPETDFAADVKSDPNHGESSTKHNTATEDGSSPSPPPRQQHAPSQKGGKAHVARPHHQSSDASGNQRSSARISSDRSPENSQRRRKSVTHNTAIKNDKAVSREKPHPPASAPSSRQQRRQNLQSASLKQPSTPNAQPRPSSTSKDKRLSSRNGARVLQSQPKAPVRSEVAVEDPNSLYSMQFVDFDSSVVMEGSVEASVSVLTDGFPDISTSLTLSIIDTEDFLITKGVAPSTPPAPSPIRLPDIGLAMEMVSPDHPHSQSISDEINLTKLLSQPSRFGNSALSITSTLPSIVDDSEHTVIDIDNNSPSVVKASVALTAPRPKSRGAVAPPRSKGRKLIS